MTICEMRSVKNVYHFVATEYRQLQCQFNHYFCKYQILTTQIWVMYLLIIFPVSHVLFSTKTAEHNYTKWSRDLGLARNETFLVILVYVRQLQK